jgi:hypothetical protein
VENHNDVFVEDSVAVIDEPRKLAPDSAVSLDRKRRAVLLAVLGVLRDDVCLHHFEQRATCVNGERFKLGNVLGYEVGKKLGVAFWLDVRCPSESGVNAIVTALGVDE